MAVAIEGKPFGPPPSYDEYLRDSTPPLTAIELPPEMVSHVMQYLSASDIKDAALVCRRWYQGSLDPKVQKKLILSVKSSVTHPRPFTGLRNRPGFHLALSDIDGSENSNRLLKSCEESLSAKLLTLSLRGSNVSGPMLTTILNNCSNLVSLDISSCSSLFLSGVDVSKRLDGVVLPHLEHMDLSSLKHLTDASLCALLQLAPNLKSLELCSAPLLFASYLYSKGDSRPNSATLTFNRLVSEVASLSNSLTSINLSRTAITNSALALLAKAPGLCLKNVCLVSCKYITDSGVVALTAAQPSIEELDLASNSQLTAVSLKHIAANLKTLRYLNFTKIRLLHKDTKLLQSLVTCSKIVLSASLLQLLPVEEADVTFQRWAPSVKSLDLSYCAGVSNKVVVSMCQHLTALTELNLSSCFQLDDVSVCEISKHLTNLTALSVSWCKHVTDMGLIGVFHEDFIHSCDNECRCSREKRVAYFEYVPPICDIAPREVVPTKDDIKLTIARHGHEGVFPITRLAKLRCLDLSVCPKITDASLTDALVFPDLANLNLAMCSRVTDKGVIALASNNPLLERINLAQCGELTDQAMCALLANCRRLTHLNISGCGRVTDNTIHSIIKAGIKLKSLDISMCNISLEAIDMLERLVPTLQTIHKRYTSAGMV